MITNTFLTTAITRINDNNKKRNENNTRDSTDKGGAHKVPSCHVTWRSEAQREAERGRKKREKERRESSEGHCRSRQLKCSIKHYAYAPCSQGREGRPVRVRAVTHCRWLDMKATDKKPGRCRIYRLHLCCFLLFLLLFFPVSADKFQMGILVSFSQLPLWEKRLSLCCS